MACHGNVKQPFNFLSLSPSVHEGGFRRLYRGRATPRSRWDSGSAATNPWSCGGLGIVSDELLSVDFHFIREY